MKYRFLEDIATADIAFEAYGKDLSELFTNCGLALSETMVDIKNVGHTLKWQVENANKKLEGLLFDFLSELVFLKDKEAVVFSGFNVNITEDGGYLLKADVFGEKIDHTKHQLKVDIKGVTMHLLKVEKGKEGYKAMVVLDI